MPRRPSLEDKLSVCFSIAQAVRMCKIKSASKQLGMIRSFMARKGEQMQ